MKKRYYIALLSSSLFVTTLVQAAEEDSHWDYSGKVGPAHWAELNPEYDSCIKGKNQSPVNLTDFINAELPPLHFQYTIGPNELLNDGHTVQANFPPGNILKVKGHTFELKQLHFHAPSEHQIEGQTFPLEGHLVHADDRGNLAVVSILYQEGKPNPLIAKLWKAMPKQEGEYHPLIERIAITDLVPKNKRYDFYPGSLTTPPCTEGVEWLVLEQPVSISPQQVRTFTSVIHHPNNRPVQPLNARLVLH